jgi:hypothetical protein
MEPETVTLQPPADADERCWALVQMLDFGGEVGVRPCMARLGNELNGVRFDEYVLMTWHEARIQLLYMCKVLEEEKAPVSLLPRLVKVSMA